MNETDTMVTDGLEPKQSDLGEELLKRRYLLKGSGGQVIEAADQMYMRVATAVAGVDLRYGVSWDHVGRRTGIWCEPMANGRFLPNTPTLVNAGSVS